MFSSWNFIAGGDFVPLSDRRLPSLKLTANLTLKNDGLVFPFRAGLFSGATYVSFREGKHAQVQLESTNQLFLKHDMV